MRIGELAERAGTSTRTLRYYEAHGLVQAQRAGNGYRVYHEAELRVVREIRALLAAPDLAWRAYACSLLAEELAED